MSDKALVAPNGRRYSEETKQLAYEAWRVDPQITMEQLAVVMANLGKEVPADTLGHWRETRGWRSRFEGELLSLGAEYARAHVGGLRVAAPESVAKLRKHVQNPRENPMTTSQIKAAEILIRENRILLVAQAKLGIMPDKQPNDSDVDIEELSMDELLQLEGEGR